VRVDDLACHGHANPNVACDASILRVGGPFGKMLLAFTVAAAAEACALDQAETEAMLVVVTRRAQTAAHFTRHGITDEKSRRPRRGGESVPAKRRPGGPIAVQRALKAAGEVLAGQRLLVLGLVAAPAFAVPNRL
jgi:hypothetical protein